MGLIALAARIVTGPPAVTTDAAQALFWGRQLLHGIAPVYHSGFGITPHPLLIAYAVVCAALGSSGFDALAVASYVAFGALVWGAFRLAQELSSWLGGVLAALLLATSGYALRYAGVAFVDVPFAALVVWAAVWGVRRPGSPLRVLALLAAAGLLRPEAWALSAVYWGYLYHSRSCPHLIKAAALTLAAPLLWIASDAAISGNPLFSLQTVQHFAHLVRATPTRTQLPHVTLTYLRDLVGLSAIAAGLVGAAMIVRERERRAYPVLAVLLIELGLFAVDGIKGLYLYDRFMLIPAALVAVLAGRAVSALLASWRARRVGWEGAIALVLVAWLLASIPGRISSVQNARAQMGSNAAAITELQRFVARPAVRMIIRGCPRLQTAAPTMMPYVAWTAGAAGSQLPANWSLPAGSSAFVTMTRGQAASGWFFGIEVQQRSWRVPPEFVGRASLGPYALFTRGC